MDDMVEQPPLQRSRTERPARPQVVIVGAGFGGLSAALKLRHIDADVIVIDQRNHHLFQPLLYQVATAGLSPADIAAPIRGILGRQANTRVVLGAVTGIDREGRAVLIGERRIPYDQLVIATGARDAYFGHDDWAMVTSPLKTIEEATTMRRRILIAFEHAEDTDDADERRQLLTFVIIGGGPTGVELAGALAELVRMALARDFRHIDPKTARIILIEAGPRLLAAFAPRLSEFAAQALRRLGVEVRLSASVTACDKDGVSLGDGRIESRTVIWAAGVAASRAADWLGVASDKSGRVPVLPDLTLPGHSEIFAIGDTALIAGVGGTPLPGVAPRREAARRLCRPRHRRPAFRQGGADGVPLPRFRQSGDDRAQGRGCRYGSHQADRPHRLVGLERGAHLFPDRFSQPLDRRPGLAVVVPDVSARRPDHHRRRRDVTEAGPSAEAPPSPGHVNPLRVPWICKTIECSG
jgi:NADH dehydrogenase